MGEKTLFDKLWELHTIEKLDSENYLIAIDRIYLHDLCGMYSFQMLDQNGKKLFRKEAVYAAPDHTLSTKAGRTIEDCEVSAAVMPLFRAGCEKYGIRLFDLGDPHQGIVHIVGPETGLTLPGMTIACGDSHTCTHGALGALAMGVGTSEVYHALASSCLRVRKPKTMKIELHGSRKPNVSAMDIMLHIISRVGVDFGVGYAVEYTGEAVEAMSIDERCTLCNMTIEMGAEYGLISPDEKTLEYIKGKEYAPKGEELEALARHCREIASAPDSRFDRQVEFDVSEIDRQVSWGVNPSHTIAIGERIPAAGEGLPEKVRKSYERAYEYMDFQPDQEIRGVPIDYVFIGSCSNGRLIYLKEIAKMVEGKRIADHVKAQVVPGSEAVKREAEALGLDKILKDAGFVWGEPGCGLCLGCNGELIPYHKRCVSTTNRNFIGRQGRGARTHLASPYTAVQAALNGYIS